LSKIHPWLTGYIKLFWQKPSEFASLRSQLLGLNEEESPVKQNNGLPSTKPYGIGRNKRIASTTTFEKVGIAK